MSPQRDSVSDVIDRFGTDLERAEHRWGRATVPRRRRIQRAVFAGAGLAVAGSAAVLAIGVGGGSKLDVVSSARAALAPEGTILHMQIAYGRPGQPDDPNARELRETWSATNPDRWRYLQTMPVWKWSHGKGHMTDQQQTGEFAFADGTATNTSSYDNTFITIAGYGSSGPGTRPITWPGMPEGQDPAEALRSLLAAGKLQSAGETTLAGRSVLRLRGNTIAQKEPFVPSQPVEYDVDAGTFTPVRMLLTYSEQRTPTSPVRYSTSTIWFRVFERLPLTPENEAKLTVSPAPGAKIRHYKLPVKGQPCQKESKYDPFCKA